MKNGVFFEGGKFIGYANGSAVAKGSTKYYVERKLKDVAETAVGTSADESALAVPINTRFEFVASIVRMVARRETPSMIICGEGGLGKSYVVNKTLADSGYTASFLDDGSLGKRYTVVKGFSTAKGLYRILCENKDSIIVFDDCDAVLKDEDAMNLLKGALDSDAKRVISWNSSRDDDLPRSFLFTGGVIFISNLSLAKIGQALRTRSMCVDLAMTLDQKLERMTVIADSPDFMPELDRAITRKALALVSSKKTQAKEVSLRTLIKVARIANSGEKDWASLAEYVLVNG